MAHLNAQRTTNLGAVITHTAAAAGTYNSSVLDTHQGIGLMVFINVTAVTGSVTVTIKNVDPVSGATATVLASAAIAATGLTVLKVYPGLTAAANATANDIIGNQTQIQSVIATGPATATITVLSITGG
jgi:hypothetical protein